MTQSTRPDGQAEEPYWLGAVVRERGARGRFGVVIDCWPGNNPTGLRVRWEPLLAGEVTRCVPEDVIRVPLADTA
jgi:hypothetical protein